jgi:hypothetical protein
MTQSTLPGLDLEIAKAEIRRALRYVPPNRSDKVALAAALRKAARSNPELKSSGYRANRTVKGR